MRVEVILHGSMTYLKAGLAYSVAIPDRIKNIRGIELVERCVLKNVAEAPFSKRRLTNIIVKIHLNFFP